MEAPRGGEEEVSIVSLMRFFLPLAGTSFFITVTHTMFNAGLARLPDPELALASFAVAKSVAHIIENPVFMIRHITVAMTKGSSSYATVRRFIYMVLAIITIILGLISFTPAGPWMLETFMGVQGRVLNEAVIGLRVLFLLPVMTGLRNMLQGAAILIRRTPLLTVATVTRVIFVSVCVPVVPCFHHWHGAFLGAAMFIGGIMVEALIMYLGVRRSTDVGVGMNVLGLDAGDPGVSYGQLNRFFLPLVITSFAQTLIIPCINAGLARSHGAETALAVFSVAWGFGMMLIGPATMFHQCSLVFSGRAGVDGRRTIRIFAGLVAGCLTGIMAVFAFTEAGLWALTAVIGVTGELATRARGVLQAMCLLPALVITREYIWGLIMARGRTGAVGIGKVINFVVVFLSITILVTGVEIDPAVAGVFAFVLGTVTEIGFISVRNLRYLIRQRHATAG